MSDSSEPQRIEALESKMEQLMGMMSQVLQATSTGDGQRRELMESGNTGRGVAHNESGGASRAPPTADTSPGDTAVGAAAAAEGIFLGRRAASEPSRPGPTIDTSRRLEVPAGVGPRVDALNNRGEARDSYLAGIAAHDDSGGVLNLQGQPRVVPPVLKGGKDYTKFKHDFLLKANMLDISDHFVGQMLREVPVGDPLKSRAVLLSEGFSADEIRGAYRAWNFVDTALKNEEDRSILKRCKSPREVFEFLEKWYNPESEVATQNLYDKFHEFTIRPNSNPITALHDLEDTVHQMQERGIGRIPDPVLHARFVRAMPDEYAHAKETLQNMKDRNRGDIVRIVGTRYTNLPAKKGAQRSSRTSEHAFISSEGGNKGGARRRRGHSRGGGRGRGRGGNSVGKSGSSSSSSGGPQASSNQSNSGGGGSSTTGGGKGQRCYRCRRRGRRRGGRVKSRRRESGRRP